MKLHFNLIILKTLDLNKANSMARLHMALDLKKAEI